MGKEADSPILRVPITRRGLLKLGVATGALGPAALFEACSSDDEKQPTPPDKSGFGELLKKLNSETDNAQLETEHGLRPFLHLPFQSDSEMAIQTAFTSNHHAIDFVLGRVDNSTTWRPFTIVAPADAEYQANPDDKEGNAFFARKKIGGEYIYFYGGHLSTLNPSLPEAKTGQWIEFKAGTILGTAGDTGVKKGLVHLHFSVGRVVNQGGRLEYVIFNPYGLGEDTPREDYPDPMWSNGKMCGPDSLWLDCSQVQSVRTTVPQESETPGPVETVQPTEVATEAPTEQTIQTEPREVEIGNMGTGILHFGEQSPWHTIDIEVTSWKEESVGRKGWKGIVLNAIVRGDLADFLESRGSILTIGTDGEDEYPAGLSIVPGAPLFDGRIYINSGELAPLSDGYGARAAISAIIPEKFDQYFLTGDDSSYKIAKGQTVDPDRPLILPDFYHRESVNNRQGYFKPGTTYSGEPSGSSSAPPEATVGFNRIYREGNSYFVEVYYKNESGQDVATDQVAAIRIFTRDGKIFTVHGWEGRENQIVPPGYDVTFRVEVPMGDAITGLKQGKIDLENVVVGISANVGHTIYWLQGNVPKEVEVVPTPGTSSENLTGTPQEITEALLRDILNSNAGLRVRFKPEEIETLEDRQLKIAYFLRGQFIDKDYPADRYDSGITGSYALNLDNDLQYISLDTGYPVLLSSESKAQGLRDVFNLPSEVDNSGNWRTFDWRYGEVNSFVYERGDGTKLEYAYVSLPDSNAPGYITRVFINLLIPESDAYEAGTYFYFE